VFATPPAGWTTHDDPGEFASVACGRQHGCRRSDPTGWSQVIAQNVCHGPKPSVAAALFLLGPTSCSTGWTSTHHEWQGDEDA